MARKVKNEDVRQIVGVCKYEAIGIPYVVYAVYYNNGEWEPVDTIKNVPLVAQNIMKKNTGIKDELEADNIHFIRTTYVRG